MLKYPPKNDPRTLLGPNKILTIKKMLKLTEEISGCTAEVGVFKGGGTKIIAENNFDKKHFAYDTFEGIPNSNQKFDKIKNGVFSNVIFEEVKEYLSDLKNVILVKGYFPSTGIRGDYSFVHIDGDTYKTIIESLEFFYPQMSKGGVILIDDYLCPGFPGVKKAIEEFLTDKPEKIINFNPKTHQGAIIKL